VALAIPRRSLALAIAGIGLAVAIGRALSGALPPLSTWTQARVAGMIEGDEDETGFSDRLWLGALDGMLESDKVVMRLDGPRVDYLRGAIYDHYANGRWSAASASSLVPFPAGRSRPEGPSVTRAILAGGARDRHFLPLGADGVATRDEGELQIDRFGMLRTEPGEATTIAFQTSGGAGLPIAAPGPEDLAIAADLRPALARLTGDFTAGATTPEAKIEAIARRLRTDYRYSLQFERKLPDPLLDFLLEHKQGHCEYFASAMALLARSAGVPARVAVGYRVIERNVLGGHYVVRERNAHAWVEVYGPGRGWQTVDATPASDDRAAGHPAMGLAGALYDLAAAWWASAWTSREAALRALAVAGGAVAVLALARRIRRRRVHAAPGSTAAPVDPPPPSLSRLLDALARRGAVRSSSEPLERFAARLDALALDDAALLLRRYAAFRYGGAGDPEALARAMDGCAGRLRR
jgi:transglutaminase-like putative cysteine protease